MSDAKRATDLKILQLLIGLWHGASLKVPVEVEHSGKIFLGLIILGDLNKGLLKVSKSDQALSSPK